MYVFATETMHAGPSLDGKCWLGMVSNPCLLAVYMTVLPFECCYEVAESLTEQQGTIALTKYMLHHCSHHCHWLRTALLQTANLYSNSAWLYVFLTRLKQTGQQCTVIIVYVSFHNYHVMIHSPNSRIHGVNTWLNLAIAHSSCSNYSTFFPTL